MPQRATRRNVRTKHYERKAGSRQRAGFLLSEVEKSCFSSSNVHVMFHSFDGCVTCPTNSLSRAWNLDKNAMCCSSVWFRTYRKQFELSGCAKHSAANAVWHSGD